MSASEHEPLSSTFAAYVCADCALLFASAPSPPLCPSCGARRLVSAGVAREVLGPDWAAIIAGERRPRGLFDQRAPETQVQPPLQYLVRLKPLGELAPAGTVVVAHIFGTACVGITAGQPYKLVTRGWVVDLHQEARPVSLCSCWALTLPGHIRARAKSLEETKGANT